MDDRANERFDAKVTRTEGGCWEWTGAKNNRGYGLFSVRTKVCKLAHRYNFERHNGPIPVGKFVCHHCDNRRCVRPDHLFLGTNMDNIIDSMQKGRRKGVARPKWATDHPQRVNRELVLRGERHGMTHLTEEDVAAIRATDVSKRGSKAMLARKYGVSATTITRILQRTVWSHAA